jgi:hypothetical protein
MRSCHPSRSDYGDITVLEFFEYLEEPLSPVILRLYEHLIRKSGMTVPPPSISKTLAPLRVLFV